MGLFLAIKTSNWELRVSSLKCMAPLFSAYDRPCYQKLVPTHIYDIQSYPQKILKCFEAGGFAVKVKSGIGHAIALDEAHEMCINRDMKMAVVRPTQPYLIKTTFFFSYRIKAQKKLSSQLFPEISKEQQQSTIVDVTTPTKHWEENIEKMRLLIVQYALFKPSTTDRGLVNVFTGTKATPEQTYDLLNARKLGKQGYTNYVSHHIIKVSSVLNPPVRKKRLLTMTPLKFTKRRLSQKEKEIVDTNKYLRTRLARCNQTGQQYDRCDEQYTLLPRALAEVDGSPHKGNKSKWTEKLQCRYNTPTTTPIISALEWIPEVAIVDAMFAINTNPLRQHKSIEQYAYFLFKQIVIPHYQIGTNQVHLVFDHPNRLFFNSKDCEHNRRYGNSKNTTKEHIHIKFDPESAIPI